MKKPLPEFKNEDEEREFWAENSPLDYFDVNTVRKEDFENLKRSPIEVEDQLFMEHCAREILDCIRDRVLPAQLIQEEGRKADLIIKSLAGLIVTILRDESPNAEIFKTNLEAIHKILDTAEEKFSELNLV